MAYYVKVKPEVRDRILPSYIKGKKTFDGNIILFQSDLNGVAGLTLSERVAKIGGALLTPEEAKREIDGTTNSPVKCYDLAEEDGADSSSTVVGKNTESEVNNG